MLDGARIDLLFGMALRAAPADVVGALMDAQVTQAAGQRSGFQLTFAMSSTSRIGRELLPSGFFDPPTRVVVVATVNGTLNVLSDGVVTRHDVAPGDQPGTGRLTITGVDVSQLMDQVDLTGLPMPAMSVEAQVLLILARYTAFGMVPMVVPSVLVDIPNPLESFDSQQGTDFAHVTQLAQEVGYVFYVEPGPVPGVSTAYWGPEIRVGVPQRALTVGMDAATNVESMSFSFDGISKALYLLWVTEPNSKAPIPIPLPEVTPWNPPLGARVPPPLGVRRINYREPPHTESSANRRGLIRATLRGLARTAEAANVITGSGSLDVRRYGGLLRSRSLVGVRGAGTAYDGHYYVKSVTTSFKPGELKQRFSLSRNAHSSLTSEVRV